MVDCCGRSKGGIVEERLKTVLSSFKGAEEELIPVLQAVQQEFGYLPEEALLYLSW